MYPSLYFYSPTNNAEWEEKDPFYTPDGMGVMNENEELFTDSYTVNELIIGGTLFAHRRCHKATWVSADHHTENQIDNIAVCQRWRNSLQDIRVKRGADIGSNHHLVIAKLRVMLYSEKEAGETQSEV